MELTSYEYALQNLRKIVRPALQQMWHSDVLDMRLQEVRL